MKAIETDIFVPGRAVVIIEEYPINRKRKKKGVRFPMFDTKPVNPNNTFRRADGRIWRRRAIGAES